MHSTPGSPRSGSVLGTARTVAPNGKDQVATVGATDPLEIKAPIETTQLFYDWFGKVEGSMEREQEEHYRSYLAEVEAYVDACDEVLERLEDSRGLIREMEANYNFVEDNSRALQMACETMLEEQVSASPLLLSHTLRELNM